MLTCYCPFATCAARISYEIVKPTKCPKCNKAFADAFRPATPVTAPQPARTVEEPVDESRPLTKSALIAARTASTTRVKPRPGRATEVVHAMNPQDDPSDPVFPDDGAEEDDYADPQEVRRKARALAASITPDSILIEEDEKSEQRIFSFQDYWEAGRSAREAGAQAAPKATKRKGRR